MRYRLLTVGVVSALVLTEGMARATTYTFTTIDDPMAIGNTNATGLNNLGQIIGQYVDSNGSGHGFVDTNNTFVSFDLPGPSHISAGKGINDTGQVVGMNAGGGSYVYQVASVLTVVISVATGLGFRRRFPGSGALFYLAVASLVMPSLLVGFGIGLGFQFLGLQPSLFTSALGAQLTWTLPFGLFAMFAVVNRFNRAWEEAATDLGASAWQRLRHITLPILLPGIIGVAMGAFTLSYDEYARTTLTIGPKNTLPLEIYALISSATSPTLFAIGTVTTGASFLIIIVSLLVVLHLQRRRGRTIVKAG